MKILQVFIHYPVSSGRYYTDAFRRLGHDVRHIGDSTGNQIWGMNVADKYIHQSDGGLDKCWSDWEPDLIILHDTALTSYKHPNYTAPMVVVTQDNHVRDVEQDGVVKYFLAHFHGPIYPVDPNRKDHIWLPCATDAKLFTPSPIAWADREFDACLVGVMYPKRVEVITALRDAGFKVRAETGLLYDEYRAAYHNSRISLCVSAAGDVAQRIYETGAMGCAILTDPLLDLNDPETNRTLGLSGFAVYSNPAEAVMLAKDLLATKVEYLSLNGAIDPNEPSAGKHGAQRMMATCKPHTWDARAQTIVNWFEREYGKVASVEVKPSTVMLVGVPQEKHQEYVEAATHLINGTLPEPKPERKPFLNLGCGRVILPGERPAHHQYIPENIYQDERWVNIDRVGTVGADKVFDLFTYPWPLESNSYDGAILTHIAEHIPHEIKLAHATGYEYHELPDGSRYPKTLPDFERQKELSNLQDGFFAFFSELARVLTPGAEVHLISPYGMASDAFVDPTHTRHLFPNTFYYFVPNPDAPFEYNVGSQYEIVEQAFGFSEHAKRIMNNPQVTTEQREAGLRLAMDTQFNIVREFYVKLKVVK
jgi:hypothetical protein